jgi:hypothetical protein
MMERFREVLLAVWREACQHIEINESISGIAELLAAHVPLDFMTVERIATLPPGWPPAANARRSK